MDCLVVDRISYERMRLEWQQYRARVQELERQTDLCRSELTLTKKLCEILEQLKGCLDKCRHHYMDQLTLDDDGMATPYDRELAVWTSEYQAIKSMSDQLSLLSSQSNDNNTVIDGVSNDTNGDPTLNGQTTTTHELVLTATTVSGSVVDQLWTTTSGTGVGPVGATIVVTDGHQLNGADAYLTCTADEDLETDPNSLTGDHHHNDVNAMLITTTTTTNVGDTTAVDSHTASVMDIQTGDHKQPSAVAVKRKYNVQTKRVKANAVITGEKKFKCSWDGCEYATDNRGNFQKHYRIHTGEKPYKCQYEGCQYSCSDPARYREHKLIHSTEKGYVCEWTGCTWRFKTHKLLKNHIKACHTCDKPHKCEWPGCEKQFLNKYEVRDHMRQHTGDRPFKCEYPDCNGAFARSNTLTQHIREVHYYKKQFFCDYTDCDARYDRVDELKEHIRQRHSRLGITGPFMTNNTIAGQSITGSKVIDLNFNRKTS